MKKALPVIMGLLERETRGWFLHFREKLIYELKTQKLSDEEIEKVNILVYNITLTLHDIFSNVFMSNLKIHQSMKHIHNINNVLISYI